jgi:hypothetical protein
MISHLAQRAGRYIAHTKKEREAVAGKTRSNNSTRRRHAKRKSRKPLDCVRPAVSPPASRLPPAIRTVPQEELEIACDGASLEVGPFAEEEN